MGLSDWDGSRALSLLRQRMNRLFDEGQRMGAAVSDGFLPATDVYSTGDAVVITVELPGVADADVRVDVEGAAPAALVIHGARRFAGEGAAYHRLERSYGEFRCRVALPSDAAPARRAVRLEAGVLTVEIPRSP